MIGQLGSHPLGDLIDFGTVAGPAERSEKGWAWFQISNAQSGSGSVSSSTIQSQYGGNPRIVWLLPTDFWGHWNLKDFYTWRSNPRMYKGRVRVILIVAIHSRVKLDLKCRYDSLAGWVRSHKGVCHSHQQRCKAWGRLRGWISSCYKKHS